MNSTTAAKAADPTAESGSSVGRAAAIAGLFGPPAGSDALHLLGADDGSLGLLGAPNRDGELAGAPATRSSVAPPRATGETLLPADARVDLVPGAADGIVGRWSSGSAAKPGGALLPGASRRGAGVVQMSADGMVCPVGGDVWFTDTWGAARSDGRTHEGTDMFAAEGTPVVALAAAVVVRVDPVDTGTSLGGIVVSYVTAAGDRWYNAHLSSVADGIRIGSVVEAGDIVGYVGHTGDAATTPPHLHIEWHPGGGDAVNSYPWMARLCVSP